MESFLNVTKSYVFNAFQSATSMFNHYNVDVLDLIDLISFKQVGTVAIIHEIACHTIVDSSDSTDVEKSRMYKGSFLVLNGIASAISYIRGADFITIAVNSVATIVGILILEGVYQAIDLDQVEEVSKDSKEKSSEVRESSSEE